MFWAAIEAPSKDSSNGAQAQVDPDKIQPDQIHSGRSEMQCLFAFVAASPLLPAFVRFVRFCARISAQDECALFATPKDPESAPDPNKANKAYKCEPIRTKGEERRTNADKPPS